MRNYYKNLDRDTLEILYKGTREKIQRNRARGRPYKALERELVLIAAQLLITKPDAPRFDWQDRADLK